MTSGFLAPHAAFRAGLALAVLGTATGCGGDSPTEPGAESTVKVVISPENPTAIAALGATTQLSAATMGPSGKTTTSTVEWRSLNSAVARVESSSGLVTAETNGTAGIVASSNGVADTVLVVVRQQVSAVTLTPTTLDTLRAIGDTIRLQWSATDARQNALTDAQVTWSSSDTSIARVNAAGVVTAVGQGTAQVRASAVAPGGSGSAVLSPAAAVTVRQLLTNVARISGDQQSDTIDATLAAPLVVRALDARGAAIAGYVLHFRALDGGTVTSSATTGASGEAQATWRVGRVAGPQRVQVYAGSDTSTLAAFTASVQTGRPASISVAGGDAQTARAGDALAQPLAVLVRDRGDNAAGSATVEARVARGGGALGAASLTTDANGRASTTWQLGTAALRQTAVLAIGGSGMEVAFTAMADTMRTVYLVTPDTVSPGDTISVDVRANLRGLTAEAYGAVLGTMEWPADLGNPIFFYGSGSGDIVRYNWFAVRTMTLSASSPANTDVSDVAFGLVYVVPSSASGRELALSLRDVGIVGARTFTNLRPAVRVVGTTIHVR